RLVEIRRHFFIGLQYSPKITCQYPQQQPQPNKACTASGAQIKIVNEVMIDKPACPGIQNGEARDNVGCAQAMPEPGLIQPLRTDNGQVEKAARGHALGSGKALLDLGDAVKNALLKNIHQALAARADLPSRRQQHRTNTYVCRCPEQALPGFSSLQSQGSD